MEECQECHGEGVCEHERWEKYGENCNGTGQVESDHD